MSSGSRARLSPVLSEKQHRASASGGWTRPQRGPTWRINLHNEGDLVQPLKVCYNLLSACLHRDLIFLTPDEPEGEVSCSGLTCCFAAYKLGLRGVHENTDLPRSTAFPVPGSGSCGFVREPTAF